MLMTKYSSEGLLRCELNTARAMAGRPLLLLGGLVGGLADHFETTRAQHSWI
jgi:hypothetical protein